MKTKYLKRIWIKPENIDHYAIEATGEKNISLEGIKYIKASTSLIRIIIWSVVSTITIGLILLLIISNML